MDRYTHPWMPLMILPDTLVLALNVPHLTCGTPPVARYRVHVPGREGRT
jgi:hypothetical protein